MGKLMNDLQKQLKNPKLKKDAEECIKVYNWVKSCGSDGRVWSSQWQPMVNVNWVGTYPNSTRIHKLSAVGRAVLNGIESV